MPQPSFTRFTLAQCIHTGTVSLDKAKYLSPTPNLRRTRASHDVQHIRYMTSKKWSEVSRISGAIDRNYFGPR